MSAIHGEGIAAAWGSIYTNNFSSTFGVANIDASNGSNIEVTLTRPMASTNYCVVANAAGPTADPDFITVTISSTTLFYLSLFTKTGATIDPAALDVKVSFVVYGR